MAPAKQSLCAGTGPNHKQKMKIFYISTMTIKWILKCNINIIVINYITYLCYPYSSELPPHYLLRIVYSTICNAFEHIKLSYTYYCFKLEDKLVKLK